MSTLSRNRAYPFGGRKRAGLLRCTVRSFLTRLDIVSLLFVAKAGCAANFAYLVRQYAEHSTGEHLNEMF